MGRTKLDPSDVSITNSKDDPLSIEETLDTIAQQVTPGTEKLANTEWFDSTVDPPLPQNRAAKCRVDFTFTDNDARISFTYDNTNYAFLFEGVVLKAGTLYSVTTSVENGNVFNIRADQNITIEKCIMVIEGQQMES